MENKDQTIIVGVRHINFDDTVGGSIYYFKSQEDLDIGDIVLLNTRHGTSIGKVYRIIASITIEELLQLTNLARVIGNYEIKQCKKLPNYSLMDMKINGGMPF